MAGNRKVNPKKPNKTDEELVTLLEQATRTAEMVMNKAVQYSEARRKRAESRSDRKRYQELLLQEREVSIAASAAQAARLAIRS